MSKSSQTTPKTSQKPSPGIIHAQQTTFYKGQLPPPEMLRKFEEIQPGFTDRLLKMVENESIFKQEQDKQVLASFSQSAVLGIIFAFLSVLVISSVAVYAIYKGFGTAAASIMATCVVGVIIAFIQRRRLSKEERKG
jgi:uncharacterized membrane protein